MIDWRVDAVPHTLALITCFELIVCTRIIILQCMLEITLLGRLCKAHIDDAIPGIFSYDTLRHSPSAILSAEFVIGGIIRVSPWPFPTAPEPLMAEALRRLDMLGPGQ